MVKEEGGLVVSKPHTACVVVYRLHRVTSDREFLVMDYQSVDPATGLLTPKEVRFVCGTNKVHRQESSEQTGVRKLHEETSLITTPDKLGTLDWEPAGKNHVKFGYYVHIDDCRGKMRNSALTLHGDVMSHPYWVSARELEFLIAPVHRWIYNDARDKALPLCA